MPQLEVKLTLSPFSGQPSSLIEAAGCGPHRLTEDGGLSTNLQSSWEATRPESLRSVRSWLAASSEDAVAGGAGAGRGPPSAITTTDKAAVFRDAASELS